MYYGDKGTTIEYNPELKEWLMRSVLHPNVSANTTAPFYSLSLGVHNWIVMNDIECQEGMSNITLSLSSCSMSRTHPAYLWRDYDTYYKNIFTNYLEEFICHDGLCVDLGKRCNGIVDCQVMTYFLRLDSSVYCSRLVYCL